MRRIYAIFLISLFAAATLSVSAKVTTTRIDESVNMQTDYTSTQLLSSKNNEVQRKSSYNPTLNTAPLPFNLVSNPHDQIAVSTGYYVVDFADDAPAYWKPSETIYSLDENPERWVSVLPGPRVVEKTYWDNNKEEGLRFFRNPAYPVQNNGNFFEHNEYFQDTTDNAFAGPMPLKLVGGFYFNGIRYDSFYVTTNGLIALTNRRYFYDEFGNKYIPSGETSAYDPNSMDYFVGYIGSENRNRVGTGVNDAVTDDFGYNWSILGGNKSDPNGGIRGDAGNNGDLLNPHGMNNITSSSYKPALIGFMYGDYELSQFSNTSKKVDNHGRVSYFRTIANDKIVIYFENLAVGQSTKITLGWQITWNAPDSRPSDEGYTAVSGQTILNRNDSSITIIYERFMGGVKAGGTMIQAKDIFRGNSVVGVYGFGRHANYNVTGGPNENSSSFPWVREYEQYTQYFSYFRNPASYPQTFTSLKFKQHQNTLRVVDIQYRVRKQDPNASLAFTEKVNTKDVNNYELLAGNDHLGAIQPVAIIQNVSNDIQAPTGVNFVPQDLNFYARFRVLNKATGRLIYNRAVPVDNKCLSTPDDNLANCEGNPDVRVRLVTVTIDKDQNYQAEVANYPGTNPWNGKTRTGIPPYGYVQVKFPPFEPNEFARDENNKLYQIGRMAAFVVADATNPNTNKKLGDAWPFDDTAGVDLHVMRLHNFFSDDAREFHIIDGVPIPSVQKWVSIDAEVVSGDILSRHPLAPRGKFTADNNANYFLSSPVIKMNRVTTGGQDNTPGDQLRSHPIDMRGRYGSVISLSVQRTLDKEFWDRGYGDNLLVGPEPRAVLNRDPFTVFNTVTTAVSAVPDMLALEIMQPSENGVANITNVKDARWRNHPRRNGVDPETKVPALGIYGAGGYLTGFLESDRDSSLAMPNVTTREANSLRADIYDDGFDFIYKKYFIPIPDTFIRAQNEGAKNFRFRLKMYATNDKKCPQCTNDDDDNFLIDNISVLFKSKETTDIEVSAVSISWPYTEAPATQASKVPIEVTATNNTANDAPFYFIKVKIYRGTNTNDPKNLVYCNTRPITYHDPNNEIVRAFPDFEARKFGEGDYRVQAIIVVPGGDLEALNDTTYTDFKIKFGATFAYDPVDNPTNDIGGGAFPTGRGLNIEAYAYGGQGSAYGQSGGYNELQFGSGYVGGSISGQIAMKFELLQADTIYGYDALFGTINQAPDHIALSIYNGKPDSDVPTDEIVESRLDRTRGRDDRTDKLVFGKYVRYLMPKGIVLPKGTYWISIAQLGETGLELGGSKQRTGLRTMSVYVPPPIGMVSPVGGSGVSLNIHKEFRKRAVSGNLLNNSYFAFENTRGSNKWTPFTPSIGNVGYAHLHHFGWVPSEGTTLTLTNGTWIPLIRPFLGAKASGNQQNVDECDVPINLVSFEGEQRKSAIDLSWTTATEENNKGFYIEKRAKVNSEFNEWEQITFVNGNGNTKTSSYYSYSDKNVKAGTTYQYKLRQVDFDGTQNCHETDIVTVQFGGADLVISNYPNPVKDMTKFEYTTSKNGNVKIEVLDLLGNVVKTLLNDEVNAGTYNFDYDATDAIGNRLTSGTYIYRISANGQTQSAKMSVVK